MENLLSNIEGVVVYIDDVSITGPDEKKHLAALEVLERMEKAGLRMQKQKCRFMMNSVEYLGYRVDAEGIHPVPKKVHGCFRNVIYAHLDTPPRNIETCVETP